MSSGETEAAAEIGDNDGPVDIKHRAELRVAALKELEEAKAEVKKLKEEDKSKGINEKAMSAAIKSMVKGAKYHANQLMFELEIASYREAVGLTTDAEEAQALAVEEANKKPTYAEGSRFDTRYGSDDERIEAVGRAHGMPADTVEAVKSKRKKGLN